MAKIKWLVVVAGILFATATHAGNIIDDWANVKAPPAPQLKPVTVDPKTTALLVLDLMNQNCGKRPSCIAEMPAMKQLVESARAAKMLIVYSVITNTTAADVMKDVAPIGGEPVLVAGPDKFIGSDLEKILKDKGIMTVIVTGTAAHGAVLYTVSGAAFRGFKVVAPVDGLSADNPFAEMASVWTMMNAPFVSANTTVTRIDMIKF
jgi:nicotinamidase-related amidase